MITALIFFVGMGVADKLDGIPQAIAFAGTFIAIGILNINDT